MGWGGVGCDSIRHYCKTWWEATLRIRHYCKTWCDATLRMGWGGVGCDSIRLADRHWRSCKISHAVKRKDHFVRSPGFEAQNPVRVANHTKTDVFFSWLFPTWNRAGATAKQEFLSNHGPVPGPPGCLSPLHIYIYIILSCWLYSFYTP